MENILSIKNLSISIGHRELIKNISFNIRKGDAVLLSGANGIGKSTLLKSILNIDNS